MDERDGTNLLLPIGVWVRKATFAPGRSRYFSGRETRKRCKDLFFRVIASKLPNLDVIVWEDGAGLDDDFIEAISHSSVKHVKLELMGIRKSWLGRPSPAPAQWDIRSLDLDIKFDRLREPDLDSTLGNPVTIAKIVSISAFLNTLFRCCSSTLESLNWSHKLVLGSAVKLSLDKTNLEFPNLRSLKLSHANFEPDLFLIFLGPSLRHLEIPGTSLDLIPKSPKTCEFLRYLQTLVVNVYEDDISDPSLAALGTIDSLEQLILRVGRNTIWKYNWLIDHGKLRRLLKGLFRLKKLTLLHDTYYRSERQHILPARFYDEGTVINSDFQDAKARPYLVTEEHYGCEPTEITEDGLYNFKYTMTIQNNIWGFHRRCPNRSMGVCIWERAHRNRMLAQTETYAEVFPKLEWIYCGQLPMELRLRLGKDGVVRKEASPLSDWRYSYPFELYKTWGIEE
ncbi:hypothetical protein ACHAPE_004632 [Trichoderma viride]